MDEVTVVTNHVPRDIVDAWALSEKERKEFDYIDWVACEKGEDSRSFFRYKGNVYDLGDFDYVRSYRLPADSFLHQWDGYISDSFFSGIVVKYVRTEAGGLDDSVIVGRFYS